MASSRLPADMLSGPMSAALVTVMAIAAIPSGVDARSADSHMALHPQRSSALQQHYASLPLSFIENRGQVDKLARFYIHASSYSIFFTPDGHVLRLASGTSEDAKAHVMKVQLVDAATHRIESREQAEGIVSYFTGPRAEWKLGIPTHSRIEYVQPWPGIDLAYSGNGGTLESIYTVAPRADPTRIKLRYQGQKSLKLDKVGNLVYSTSVGEVKETAPIFFQQIEGKRKRVEGRYRLLDSDTVGFEVATYDRNHPLVIDPTLVYAGYIGGSGTETGADIAVDATGNIYITGQTNSNAVTFPVRVGPDLTPNGGTDAYVAKVSAAGTGLIYASYLGGSAFDDGRGIAVDAQGNAYVTGFTDSTEASFPVLVGPDLTANGSADAFVTKINAAGTALVYSGFIGGALSDNGEGIAVDIVGNAYVCGGTASGESSFPVLVGPDLSFNGQRDAFVAKVNPAGTALVYAGYVGGSSNESPFGIAVDAAGNAYAAGSTNSTEATFPVLVGPDISHNGGGNDGYIIKINASGSGLVYGGYIGGSGSDGATGVALDPSGSAYVAGQTSSSQTSFPVFGGPDLTYNANGDAFVAKVSSSGTSLTYAGYIGGTGAESGSGIDVDAAGNAYVIGFTESTQASFPVLDGPDVTYNGGFSDAFVAKVNVAGTSLVYATYIGGSGNDRGDSIALGDDGNAYATGNTDSTQATFPVLVGPDLAANGAQDAFVALLREPSEIIFRNGFE